MRDVAARAGVSIKTVSRVVNGEPGVSVMAQDPFRIGIEAAELLFGRLDGETGPSQQRLISTRLIARGSGEIRPIAAGVSARAAGP